MIQSVRATLDQLCVIFVVERMSASSTLRACPGYGYTGDNSRGSKRAAVGGSSGNHQSDPSGALRAMQEVYKKFLKENPAF